MDSQRLRPLAKLIREKNSIEDEIARLIGRPALVGHVGEWIAGEVFNIELENSANQAGYDGRFKDGVLQGRTVNIKWYPKRDGLLDINESALPDYFLVRKIALFCTGRQR